MKLNRKWLLVLALLVSVTVATTSTLAFLTDRDTKTNTFTMGNVDITLDEEFVDKSPLYPGQDVNKDAQIVNDGTQPAWVWMTVAVPAELDEHLELLWTDDYADAVTGPTDDTAADGTALKVYTVLVEEQLAAGDETGYILDGVKLADNVDYQSGQYVAIVDGAAVPVTGINDDGTVDVIVTAYAMQVDNVASAENAFDAYARQWGTSGHVCWDGSVDTSWYNDTDTTFEITTAEQLAGLAQLVDAGNSFAGKTIKLGADICLETTNDNGEPMTFDPIGDDVAFAGTFDGQDHTIENLYQSGWDLGYEWGAYGSIGLFGQIDSATIKNLTISGSETFVEGGDVAGIAGSATGTCTFENITIQDSQIATYNNGCGGLIGWSGEGEYTFTNITIADDVVLAGLWGSFDSSIGGVVGQGEPGATYTFDNVDIACRIDAYNDVTAAYDYYNYRMCGMIIGRLAETTTIDGTNYPDTSKYNITCDDVTVTYGDWANYHYCRASGASGVRVEAGYQYGGIAADYDHSVCTVHHNELMAFDQVFGGDQYGVKGLPAYDGVTVVYNNH